MTVLEATFTVSAAERGTLVVEFSYSQTTPGAAMVRVWKRDDFGSDRPPLLELPNVKRAYKPCASHVADLVALAFHAKPASVFGEKRAAACDALIGETMVVFSDLAIANRYMVHRWECGRRGIIALAEDTRERTGLCVVWRDPVPPKQLAERLANCRWLLEETLAGRSPWPQPAEVTHLGKVGGKC